jgi:hypothetical protein
LAIKVTRFGNLISGAKGWLYDFILSFYSKSLFIELYMKFIVIPKFMILNFPVTIPFHKIINGQLEIIP